MRVEPLFPTELNIASVIRWPGHTCLVKRSDHIWSLFPASRGIFCNMIYFRANESQRFIRGLDHVARVNDQTRTNGVVLISPNKSGPSKIENCRKIDLARWKVVDFQNSRIWNLWSKTGSFVLDLCELGIQRRSQKEGSIEKTRLKSQRGRQKR